MNYWLTTQWPPTQDSPREHGGVWLRNGKEDAGRNMRPGDLVFIYETKTGRPRKDGLAYWPGRQGIVVLAEVLDVNLEEGFARSYEVYSDDSELLWKMIAQTQTIDSSNFCRHDDVCDCLRYSRNYFFRGFGRSKSGLRELFEPEFRCLRDHFR